MLSRTLILATVMLWIGGLAAGPALAQENLEAGKSPSQIFAGTCNACHKSPRGLLKTVPPGSLAGFLRQHYTTSPNMANVLSAYLVSNGANDPKAAAAAAKDAKGAKEGAKESPREVPREARQEARPVEQLDRFGRRQHPMAAPPQEAAAPPADRLQPEASPQSPSQAASKGSTKQKLSKRGRPGEEAPKEEPPAAAIEPPPSDSAKVEPARPESGPPATAEPPSQSAKAEPPKDTPAIRPDPVPQVTPAPATPASSASPAAAAPAASAPASASPAPASAPPTVSTAASNNGGNSGNSEPMPVMALPPSQPAVTASAPPQPPVPPAGPPVPPISQ
jgi:hypothetical protein